MVLIYTTCHDEEEARKLGGILAKRKLAACVNIWRIGSIYMWEENLKEEKEVAVLVKTSESKVQDVEDLITQNHSYAVPFIGVIEVKRINHAFKEFMSHAVH